MTRFAKLFVVLALGVAAGACDRRAAADTPADPTPVPAASVGTDGGPRLTDAGVGPLRDAGSPFVDGGGGIGGGSGSGSGSGSGIGSGGGSGGTPPIRPMPPNVPPNTPPTSPGAPTTPPGAPTH